MPEFEWDEDKAAENFRKHGLSFRLAEHVFGDTSAQYRLDLFADEERFQVLGRVPRLPPIVVVYTSRYDGEAEVIRIISARFATAKELRIWQAE